MSAGVSGLGVSSDSLRAVGTDTPFKYVRSPTVLSDITSLRGRTGCLRRTVRNPLRSDQFLPANRLACQLNASILKLSVLPNVDALTIGGAHQ